MPRNQNIVPDGSNRLYPDTLVDQGVFDRLAKVEFADEDRWGGCCQRRDDGYGVGRAD
jgi:hypothetical protein